MSGIYTPAFNHFLVSIIVIARFVIACKHRGWAGKKAERLHALGEKNTALNGVRR